MVMTNYSIMVIKVERAETFAISHSEEKWEVRANCVDELFLFRNKGNDYTILEKRRSNVTSMKMFKKRHVLVTARGKIGRLIIVSRALQLSRGISLQVARRAFRFEYRRVLFLVKALRGAKDIRGMRFSCVFGNRREARRRDGGK